MRGIPDRYAIILIVVYWILTLIAWYNLQYILKKTGISYLKTINLVWFGWGVFMSLLIVRFYLFFPDPSGHYFYALLSLVNAFLIADLSCKIPMLFSAMLFLLFRRTKSRIMVSWMGIVLSAGVGLTFIYGIFAGGKSVTKSEITLEFQDLPPSFDGFRIVQFSDMHLGSFMYKKTFERMVLACNRFKPDLILFTGDLVNNYAAETENWSESFRKLHASKGMYAVPGNHDYGDYSVWNEASEKELNFHQIENALHDFGFLLLRNEAVKISTGGDSIFIAGVENWGHPPFPRYADLQQVSTSIPDHAFCILLSHNPAHWKSEITENEKYKLTLSGHTHGLQWGINMAGIRFSLISLLYPEWGGLYEFKDRYLYVNQGTGIIGMHFRIDMPAEITLITLKKS